MLFVLELMVCKSKRAKLFGQAPRLISVSTTETSRNMWMNAVMKEGRERRHEEKELTYEIDMRLMPAHSNAA